MSTANVPSSSRSASGNDWGKPYYMALSAYLRGHAVGLFRYRNWTARTEYMWQGTGLLVKHLNGYFSAENCLHSRSWFQKHAGRYLPCYHLTTFPCEWI